MRWSNALVDDCEGYVQSVTRFCLPSLSPGFVYRQQEGGEVLISRILHQRMLPGEQVIDDTEG
jgi:hypothetical protein